MRRLISCLMAVLATAHLAVAQDAATAKYKAAAEEMRKEVWAWTKPEFNQRTVPAEFANASKVVIARHRELNAESKSRVAYLGITFAVRKTQQLTNIFRELVKLNDKSAVEEYSEISFTMLAKSTFFLFKDKSATYVGIRIIKPDGSTKEYKGDDMVLTQNDANKKKAKLAIPDLAPGDILDYFVANVEDVNADFSDDNYNLYLFEDAPIMHVSFHGMLGKKYAVEYRSYNGAPDLDVSKNSDEDIEISAVAKNIPAYKSHLWVSPAHQLPFIRLTIALGYSGMGSGYMGTRKPGSVSKNTPLNEVVDKVARRYATSYFANMNKSQMRHYYYEEVVRDMKDAASRRNTPWKKMSDTEKADFAYYFLRYKKLMDREPTEDAILNYADGDYNKGSIDLWCLLKEADVPATVLVAPGYSDVALNEVMETSDFNPAVYIEENGRLMQQHSIFETLGQAGEGLEGVKKSYLITFDKTPNVFSNSGINKLAAAGPGPEVRQLSTAADNSHLEQLNMQLGADGQLQVQRTATLKGQYKHGRQAALITFEEYVANERKEMMEEMGYLEALEDSRKTRNVAGELRSVFAKAKKAQQKAFEEDAKDWFETEITGLTNPKIINLGVHHSKPDFVHSSSFQMNGLVKKAGNNLILEVGKLQGSPVQVKPEQRNRGKLDVYMPCARSFSWEVKLDLPQGYTAQGLEALNKQVQNAAGAFTTSAINEGSSVVIKITKQYNHRFEPSANWNDLLAIIDTSNEFTNAKVLVKKG